MKWRCLLTMERVCRRMTSDWNKIGYCLRPECDLTRYSNSYSTSSDFCYYTIWQWHRVDKNVTTMADIANGMHISWYSYFYFTNLLATFSNPLLTQCAMSSVRMRGSDVFFIILAAECQFGDTIYFSKLAHALISFIIQSNCTHPNWHPTFWQRCHDVVIAWVK